jgi:hypothetical protein
MKKLIFNLLLVFIPTFLKPKNESFVYCKKMYQPKKFFLKKYFTFYQIIAKTPFEENKILKFIEEMNIKIVSEKDFLNKIDNDINIEKEFLKKDKRKFIFLKAKSNDLIFLNQEDYNHNRLKYFNYEQISSDEFYKLEIKKDTIFKINKEKDEKNKIFLKKKFDFLISITQDAYDTDRLYYKNYKQISMDEFYKLQRKNKIEYIYSFNLLKESIEMRDLAVKKLKEFKKNRNLSKK